MMTESGWKQPFGTHCPRPLLPARGPEYKLAPRSDEMPVSLSKMMDEFSPEDRTEIEGHARQLIAERRSLMQIRKALKLTQSDIAEVLKTSQAHVAQIERKRDAMVSTIERIVNA